uniref:Palladin n=1 Tax=Denticeps clupeoides TaxID=299321 RepID=A0AAY4DP65_9TELE
TSEPSSDAELFLDSLAEMGGGDCDFPELSAFLSQDEISRSLDLAREAMSDAGEPSTPASPPSLQEQALHNTETKGPCETDSPPKPPSSQLSWPTHPATTSTASPENFICHKSIPPVYKQDRPRLVHTGLELSDRAASATEFCSRAATFIEELSSIFRGSNRPERQGDNNSSSSPDSGYLSPKSHRSAPPDGSFPPAQREALQTAQTCPAAEPMEPTADGHQDAVVNGNGPMAPPRFTQKLKSQEVAEGSPIRLECRVAGKPQPLVRWFCEGRELHHCPDIQICRDDDLHTLVIAEAFEDDTGRYTCVASNALGADNTSAEVYIEGASSSDSETEGSVSRSRSGAMPQVQKKTTSVSLTIRTASPRSPEMLPHRSTLVQPLSSAPQRIHSFSDLHPQALQDAQASEGQVVVLECRVRASPPVQVQWFRQGQELQDSPDFRILQKKPRSAAEPEEICTLVIAEAFPEDGGLFCCTATNQHGSVSSAADLTVTPGDKPARSPKTRSDQQAEKKERDERTGCQTDSLETFLKVVKPADIIHGVLSSRLSHRNAEQLKQLQDHILLEQLEAANWQQTHQEAPSPSPPLPPPPSFQELEVSTMQTSTFNYARPKQFIAAQSPSSSGSSLPSVESPSSPSFPPPPPPFLSSSSNVSSPSTPQDFPPPPPPPPPPISSCSDTSSPFSSTPQSPANYLASVLPTTPSTPPVNALGLVCCAALSPVSSGFSRKSGRTPRIASDSEIQGSKDAVIQDLERKLRFKDERLSNGQQRLTYEEKMARRLLGADNAATVFNVQEQQEENVTQVHTHTHEYKVSSFEQRLISEIEFRLERSPVEESDDDVQHDEDGPGEGVTPFFDHKLKHYKVFEGMPVTFTCKVIGDPQPKIYWFKDGKQISKRSEHYRIGRESDGTCTLHTASASLDDDGNYTIMAGNPAGRVSCTGRMMIQAVNQRGRSQRAMPGHIRRPRSRSRDSGDENENIQERHFRPHFLQAPGDLIVQEGKLCRMDCKVSGLPTPDLIWQLNGQTIRPDSAHKMLVRENGVHSLVIEPVTNRDAGIYTCIASNRAGQNSFNLELIVAAKEMHKAPVFIEKLQNTRVGEGSPVRLECRVSGVPSPQIFWKRENESLTHNTDRISMHQDNFGYLCMIIQPALKEDAGWYTVSAKNEAGIVSSTARLDVHSQWQQTHTPKPKKVRPSTSRYAALTEKGLDVKAAFFPDSSPLQPGSLVESEDL